MPYVLNGKVVSVRKDGFINLTELYAAIDHPVCRHARAWINNTKRAGNTLLNLRRKLGKPIIETTGGQIWACPEVAMLYARFLDRNASYDIPPSFDAVAWWLVQNDLAEYQEAEGLDDVPAKIKPKRPKQRDESDQVVHADLADATPQVELVNGVPMVSSLKVAEHFGKRHLHVLEAIRELTEKLKEDGLLDTESNFRSSEYTDSTGRKLPTCLLSKKGFSLLAMRFTGKKALRWQVRYMEAFEAMEAKLIEQAKVPAIAMDTAGLEAKLDTFLAARVDTAFAKYQRVITEYIGEEVAAVEMGLRRALGEENAKLGTPRQ